MAFRLGYALLVVALAGCRGYGPQVDEGFSSGSTDPSHEITISKMGGGIEVANAPYGASLNTMGGGIHVGKVASFAHLKTMGGEIKVDHASGSVDATTMGGEINIGSSDGPVKANSMGGGITVHEVGSSSEKRDIVLTSKGGDIKLTVPKDFPMEVKITLAYTRTDRQYHITQHAGLDVRESDNWDDSMGTRRKYIRARGIVGSGLNHVTIETINGNVVLNQE